MVIERIAVAADDQRRYRLMSTQMPVMLAHEPSAVAELYRFCSRLPACLQTDMDLRASVTGRMARNGAPARDRLDQRHI